MEDAAQGRSRSAGNSTHDTTYGWRPRDFGGQRVVAGLCVYGDRTLDRLRAVVHRSTRGLLHEVRPQSQHRQL